MIEKEPELTEDQLRDGFQKHLTRMKHEDRKSFNRLRKPLNERFAKTVMNRLK